LGKLLVVILLLCVLFSGCRSSQTLETVMDTPVIEQQASALQIVFDLPEEAAQQTMEEDDGSTIYFCRDFELITKTIDGGDLSKTILNTTGFEKESLEIIEDIIACNCQYFFSKVCEWVFGDGYQKFFELDSFEKHLNGIVNMHRYSSITEIYVLIVSGFFWINDGKVDDT